MKTEKELNNDIIKMTIAIEAQFPELSKYIEEMPITIANTANPEINMEILTDYHDSLVALFKKYAANHK
jgi:hypothetical protein